MEFQANVDVTKMARSSEFQDTAAGTVRIHRFGYKMDDGEIFSAGPGVRGKYSV